MKIEHRVAIETFPTRAAAEIARGFLEASGVEAFVAADDAGGLYPMLALTHGVQLQVRPEDEERAREILRSVSLQVVEDEDPEGSGE
jgi:hypothetical protein